MPPTTITRLAHTVQDVLTAQANAWARPSGFVQRASKLTGARFVQTLVFAYLAHRHPTWEHLAQTAGTLGLSITGSGLQQRYGWPAAELLRHVLECAATASLKLHAAPVAVPILQRFSEVLVQDSTQIALPAALAELWAGARAGQAAVKVQARLGCVTGTLHLALAAGRANDRTLAPEQRTYPAGSLRLADLGYFDLPELAAQAAAGAFWLTHVLTNTACYLADGTRWSVLDLLAHKAGRAALTAPHGLALTVGVTARLPCRLIARRVPRAVAAERTRRLHATARRKGETVSATQVAMLRWVVFITNAPVALLTADEAFVLARVRWQIELLFKLWKSHGALDESHCRAPVHQLCEFYAKLLALLIQHWTFLVGVWHQPDRSLVKAAQVVRDRALVLSMNFATHTRLCHALRILVASMAVGCRITKRKAVPATFQHLLALTETTET